MNSEKKQIKHSFFYASCFMAVLVLGSVLVYSVFLPQNAPKQITLAVLPFTQDDEFTPLSVGFTVALRDSIALSRDIAVVDTVSTNSVIWDEVKRQGMSHILALTHFVDGQLRHSADGATTLDFRVVNVSHPNWKESLVTNITVADESIKPFQDLRDEVTLAVRTALYDNSVLRTEPTTYTAIEYLDYMKTLGKWLLDFKNDIALTELHGAFQTKQRSMFETRGIATEPSRLLWNAVESFKQSLDTRRYVRSVLELAGEYPNSLAVLSLVHLAYDLDELGLAEHAALRVARLQPQSAVIALKIGFLRFLHGDMEGSEKAMRIAALRDDRNIVPYFAAAADSFMNSTSAELPKVESLNELVDGFNDTIADDFLLTLLIHSNALSSRDASYTAATDRLWRSPPMWMSKSDPRWQRSQRFLRQNVRSLAAEVPLGFLSEASTEEAMAQLFAPRRPD